VRWKSVEEISLLQRGSGARILRIATRSAVVDAHLTQQRAELIMRRSAVVDAEILCNQDQADAIDKLLKHWITEARRVDSPFLQPLHGKARFVISANRKLKVPQAIISSLPASEN